MKVNITLNNPKLCEGCPILYDGIVACNLSYWPYQDPELDDERNVIRPQQCIDDNGE